MDARFVKLAPVAELLPGKTRCYDLNGTSVLLCRIQDEVHAVENRCPHTDAPLTRARIREGMIVCPVHGAKFDPRTGAACSPPATTPLTIYRARLCDGWVEVAPI